MEKTINTKSVENKTEKKILIGNVVSNKMKDTIVVEVNRFVKHPKYGKYFNVSKKFKAHDAGSTKNIGDRVSIEECAPISKDKHFKVI